MKWRETKWSHTPWDNACGSRLAPHQQVGISATYFDTLLAACGLLLTCPCSDPHPSCAHGQSRSNPPPTPILALRIVHWALGEVFLDTHAVCRLLVFVRSPARPHTIARFSSATCRHHGKRGVDVGVLHGRVSAVQWDQCSPSGLLHRSLRFAVCCVLCAGRCVLSTQQPHTRSSRRTTNPHARGCQSLS